MDEVAAWLAKQAQRNARAVRLEDALLLRRFAPYFAYRLRYFVLTSIVAALIHALKVALLYNLLPRTDFVLVVLVAAVAGLLTDLWWGTLERMRSRIRSLQRDDMPHLIPREIAGWIVVSARLCACMALAAVSIAVIWLVVWGRFNPVELYALTLLAGTGVGFVVRAYHSGAYAVRRVYRPLPSLLAPDAASLLGLVVLWPLLGTWAFPASEALSIVIVVATSVHFIGKTYRILGLPTLGNLLRTGRPAPLRAVLSGLAGPGLAFALTSLEALIVIIALGGDGADAAPIVALVAGLGPVIRAGFEWARLLYFDMVRLEIVLLKSLRRGFDRAVNRLALVVGLTTWATAVVIGALFFHLDEVDLIVALLPFFMTRSVLAAVQVRTFVGRVYLRLALVGVGGVGGLLATAWLVPAGAERVVAVTVVLAVSAVVLVVVGASRGLPAQRVVPALEWFDGLRRVRAPVRVTIARFDARHRARGVTREACKATVWRQRAIGRRVSTAVRPNGGVVTNLGSGMLAWYEPIDSPRGPRHRREAPDSRSLERLGAGLFMRRPDVVTYVDGRSAAASVLRSVPALRGGESATPLPGSDQRPSAYDVDDSGLIGGFRERFPDGIAVRITDAPPPSVRDMTSRERAELLRSAMAFAAFDGTTSRRDRGNVTALVRNGRLEAIFLVDELTDRAQKLRWLREVRILNLRRAALGDEMAQAS